MQGSYKENPYTFTPIYLLFTFYPICSLSILTPFPLTHMIFLFYPVEKKLHTSWSFTYISFRMYFLKLTLCSYRTTGQASTSGNVIQMQYFYLICHLYSSRFHWSNDVLCNASFSPNTESSRSLCFSKWHLRPSTNKTLGFCLSSSKLPTPSLPGWSPYAFVSAPWTARMSYLTEHLLFLFFSSSIFYEDFACALLSPDGIDLAGSRGQAFSLTPPTSCTSNLSVFEIP